MSHSILPAHEELHRAVSAIGSDIQAALALSRAALQAIASLSPAHCAAAELALESELEAAHEFSAVRTIEVLEGVRADLHGLAEQLDLVSVLEQALVNAADALPEFPELEPEAALLPQ